LTTRSPLCDHATHRMTRATRGLSARIGGASILDHPSLSFGTPRPNFSRRESLMIAQISNDGPRGGRIELHIVQRHHSADGHLPTLGRFPLVGDALHVSRAIAHMATRAALSRRRVGDDETSCRIGGSLTTTRPA